MSTTIKGWIFSGILTLAYCTIGADFALADNHSRLSGGIPKASRDRSPETGGEENRTSDVAAYGGGSGAQEEDDPCPPTTSKKGGSAGNNAISPANGQGASKFAGGGAKSGKLKVPKPPRVGDKIRDLDKAYRMARKSLEEAEKSSQEEFDRAIKNLKTAIGMLEAVGWQGRSASD